MSELEDHIVVYFDFLGTAAAIRNGDRAERLLELFLSLKTLRGEFKLDEKPLGDAHGTHITVNPAISTFSDHVVLSFQVAPLVKAFDERSVLFGALPNITRLVAWVAARSLAIGFLLRGGAAVGRLYHKQDIVFGEAMVEAYEIESRISNYPRIVVSPRLAALRPQSLGTLFMPRDDDGLFHINYFHPLLNVAAPVGDAWQAGVREWYAHVATIISEKLRELDADSKLNEYAKWCWFVRKWRSALVNLGPGPLSEIGISLDALPNP